MSHHLSRRAILLALSYAPVVVFLRPLLAQGSTIAVIDALAELLGKAAESLSKLGDSIAHIVELGVQAYDGVVARSSYNQLVALRIDLEALVLGRNAVLVESIEEYIEMARNPEETFLLRLNWLSVVERVDLTLQTVRAVLDETNEVRSDFVLQDAYRSIVASLRGRGTILEQLAQIQAPQTEKELEALEKVARNYRRLMVNLQEASDELAAYIRAL